MWGKSIYLDVVENKEKSMGWVISLPNKYLTSGHMRRNSPIFVLLLRLDVANSTWTKTSQEPKNSQKSQENHCVFDRMRVGGLGQFYLHLQAQVFPHRNWKKKKKKKKKSKGGDQDGRVGIWGATSN